MFSLIAGWEPGEYEKCFSPSLATAISGLERRPLLPTWCPLVADELQDP
jgi:hypothetical protein